VCLIAASHAHTSQVGTRTARTNRRASPPPCGIDSVKYISGPRPRSYPPNTHKPLSRSTLLSTAPSKPRCVNGRRGWRSRHRRPRRIWAVGEHPDRLVGAVGMARVGGDDHRAAAADASSGTGGGDVHDQLSHVHVHADLLRAPREPGARRRVAGQHRHPDLCLRAHGNLLLRLFFAFLF
jgi:hypothetical protein